MPASLKDVANLAHVSLTTASHALNGKKVNEETRQRVIEAAKKLHYYANVNGRNLITRKTHNLSLVVLNEQDVGDYTEELTYYYQLLKGVMDSAQQRQYSVKYEVVSWERMAEEEYFEEKVYGRSVDGMIVIPQYKHNSDFIKLFKQENFPYVLINPWSSTSTQHVVRVDNFQGGKAAALYLQHFPRIYFINGPENHISSSAIERGFLSGLLKKGVRFDRNRILYSDYTYEGGRQSMKILIEREDVMGAVVFCANDYMATGAMAVLQESGLKIPEDASVMGFDDMDVAKCVFPSLTTMRVDTRKLGACAVERLLQLIDGGEGADVLSEIILTPVLKERNTVLNDA